MIKVPEPLSHSYLITGGNEAGRRELALRMTQAYLCEGNPLPCGSCRPCRKVTAGIHPDISRITLPEEKKEIVVDQIRALRTDAYIRPNEGRRKIYVIDPADGMNEVAQNALLKVLEDGPAYAAFLLLAEQPGRLLETIRSRCEMLALPPEEEQLDPAQLARAEELARLLITGNEPDLVEHMVELEQEKMKSAQMLALLAQTERCAGRWLEREPRRTTAVLRALKTCREGGVYNPGVGHTFGWLAAELFK